MHLRLGDTRRDGWTCLVLSLDLLVEPLHMADKELGGVWLPSP
jgi:hypothetical protein